MADLQQLPTNGNTSQLTGVAQLLQSFSSMAGSGTTTTKSSSDPANNDAINQLLASITSGASDDTINGVITNIFNQGKQQLGATLFQGAGGGAYNSTTQQQLAGDTLAKSVAAASAAKLQAQQQSQETAAKLLAAQSAANKTTTSQTGASPLGKVLGPALAGLSAYSKLTSKGGLLDQAKSGWNNGISPGGKMPKDLGQGDSDLPAITDSTGNGFDPGFDQFGDPTGGGGSGEGGGGGQGGSVSDLSSEETSSGELFDSSGALTSGADLGSGALESTVDSSAAAGEDVGFDAFGDSTSGAVGSEVGADIGGDVAGEAAGDVAADVGTDVAVDAAGEEAGVGIGDIALAASAAAICQESVRQGLMDAELYKQETIQGAHKLGKISVRGYHYLAIPWVLKMRKDRQLAIALSIWARAYANFIAYEIDSPRAKILHYLGRPVCYIVGLFVNEPNLQRLQISSGVA